MSIVAALAEFGFWIPKPRGSVASYTVIGIHPTEVAVHPSEENDIHELFLMCDDVQALIAEMKKKKVECSPVDEQRWGSITRLTLPGGGTLGIYQPKHASPLKVRAT